MIFLVKCNKIDLDFIIQQHTIGLIGAPFLFPIKKKKKHSEICMQLLIREDCEDFEISFSVMSGRGYTNP